MNWYTICQIFEIRNLSHSVSTSFEENWILLPAADLIEATNKALEHGKNQEELFINVHEETIHWIFNGLKHIREIELENTATEICTFSHETQPQLLIKSTALRTIS